MLTEPTLWVLEGVWWRRPYGWDLAQARTVLWDLNFPRCWGGCKQRGSGFREESPFWTLDLLQPVRENRELKHFPYYFLKSKYPRYTGNSELSSLQMRRENKQVSTHVF